MPQLRDAQTSELVAQGGALELILLAAELGGAAVVGVGETVPDGVELVYDDVGPHFNPDELLAANRETADALAAAVKVAKSADKDAVRKALADAKARLELKPERVREATAALEAARAKLEG